jgi:HTH-type transcriptional regulator/antitoxin HigA
MGMNVSDFGKIIKYQSRASEILNRKRKLTLGMIRAIHKKLGVPTDILVQEYDLVV